MPLQPDTADALNILLQRLRQETDQDRLKGLLETYDEVRWQAAQEDPWFFLRQLCKTKNEHAKVGQQYQCFPDKQYVRDLLDQFMEVYQRPSHRRMGVLKSRQMMASWFACAMMLYVCLTKPARTVGWLGKKAEDTNEMLERMAIMYRELPEIVRKRHPMEQKFGRLDFPPVRDQGGAIICGDSKICGIPQPDEMGNQVRQFTYSEFVLDEFAFQINDEAVYHALLPALGDEGMLLIISTAAPGHFQTLYDDRVERSIALAR